MAKSNNTTGSVRTKPILFSAPMVRALLEGRKTQTRRLVKVDTVTMNVRDLQIKEIEGAFYLIPNFTDGRCHVVPEIKPKYSRGDFLWVREKLNRTNRHGVSYGADGEIAQNAEWQWKNENLPAMFMPRWASRLTLRVTDVRAERLHDISEADARAEGLSSETLGHHTLWSGRPTERPTLQSAKRAFLDHVWTDLYGEHETKSVGANPWVWAYSFEVIKKNVDEVN